MQIRKFLKPRLAFFILIFIYNLSFASQQNLHICVFHINGVNTKIDEAADNLKALRDKANIRSNFISWNLLYNQTHGLLSSDLWDVFRQKRQENQNLSIDDYVAVYMKVRHLSYPKGSKDYEILKENIKDYYAEDLGYVGKNFDDIHDQFHNIVGDMYTSIKELAKINDDPKNTYVLFIPHSQGCLYANSLKNLEVSGDNKVSIGIPSENIGIFAIANPADKVDSTLMPLPNFYVGDADDSLKQYITADNDFVINSLRSFSLFTPASNQPLPATLCI